MSGVVALFGRGGVPVDRALLARMTASQRYRGPDGEGVWHGVAIGLGHTLHRTTAEAAREASPTSLGDRLFVAADARLDARDELRARLRDHAGELEEDMPDAQLLLHAYDAWGEGCLEHLLGDFSFALWDARRRKLVCAVDQLGVKPFYYADRGGLFAGGNSLRCVRMHPEVRADLDEAAVGDFLLLGGHQDRGRTIFADVARIPPGHVLVVDDQGARLARYFTWPAPAETRWGRPADCVEQFEELLACAVRDRLRASRVAIYLSGGVDSSLVALTAKRELDRLSPPGGLVAHTAVYDREIPDEERLYAGLVAERLSIPIDVQPFDGGALFDWIGRIRPAEPFAGTVMGSYLDQLDRITRRSPVILTGFDGDALLQAAVPLHWRERLAQGRVGELAREVAWYVLHERAAPPLGVRARLGQPRAKAAPRRPAWLREAFWRRAALGERWASGLDRPAPSGARDASRLVFSSPAWSVLFDTYDPGCLGRAVEVRHPLIDLRLVRFALALPAVPWCVNKYLLRRCMGALPEAVRARPKTPLAADPVLGLLRRRGFDVPGTAWQFESLSRFVDVAAVDSCLRRAPLAEDEAWPLLRAVALGAWLSVGLAP